MNEKVPPPCPGFPLPSPIHSPVNYSNLFQGEDCCATTEKASDNKAPTKIDLNFIALYYFFIIGTKLTERVSF